MKLEGVKHDSKESVHIILGIEVAKQISDMGSTLADPQLRKIESAEGGETENEST